MSTSTVTVSVPLKGSTNVTLCHGWNVTSGGLGGGENFPPNTCVTVAYFDRLRLVFPELLRHVIDRLVVTPKGVVVVDGFDMREGDG